MHFKLLIVIGFIILTYRCFSQNINKNSDIYNELVEEIASSSESSIDLSELYYNLNYLYDNPININYASEDELDRLYILNSFQKKCVIDYREKNGLFLSIYELQLVYGFDVNLVKTISPFITISKQPIKDTVRFDELIASGNHEIIWRSSRTIENQNGYIVPDSSKSNTNYYLGSPYKLYTRYKYHYNDEIYAGITLEKDAGEKFLFDENNRGFDFYSAYLQINNIEKFKHINIGDYHINYGQGLLFYTGVSFGKSSLINTIKKENQGIGKYTSVNENNYLRGFATTIDINNIDISLFLSNKYIDANSIELDTISSETISFSSFQTSGLHHTNSLLENKNAIKEQIIGTIVKYSKSIFKVEGVLSAIRYSANYIPNDKLYNLFESLDKNNYYGGLNYEVFFRKIIAFGEVAYQYAHGASYLNGVLIRMAPQLELSLLHRNYSPKYYSTYSNAFGENSTNQNESGFYAGTILNPSKNWQIKSYIDVFSFPWLKYQVDAPSNGFDYLFQIDYNHSDNLDMYWRVKSKSKYENADISDDKSTQLAEIIKTYIRYNISYKLSEEINLKNRLEILWYKKGIDIFENSILLYQDVNYQPSSKPFSGSVRLAAFDTDSYNSRIYAYENDILYNFSVPAYYNTGTRLYLNIKYQLSKKLALWLRLSQFHYYNTTSIGSGLNEIDGNTKTDFKAQLRYKF